jgi:hypothetical protein
MEGSARMRTILAALAIFVSPIFLAAQPASPWQRVYTLDESVIDIDTAQVNLLFPNRGRVSFRWNFTQAEALSAGSRIKYKSRLEVIEFDCLDRRYRPYQATLFDAAGKVISFQEMNPPGRWNSIAFGTMMEKLSIPACQLIELKTKSPLPLSGEALEKKNVERLALSFFRRMEEKQDFAPLVKEFFVPDYLSRYLLEKETDWFLRLDPEVAAQVSRADLQRYYVALMNLGYLSSLYFVSQTARADADPLPDEQLMPHGLLKLIKQHPYTAAYGGAQSDYDYLEEKIESPERLRRYTDLLESTAAIFRQSVTKARSDRPEAYQAALDELANGIKQARSLVCARECFGLPKGTKLFQIDVPVFRLQIADIGGELKVVSAMPRFQ